MKSTAERLSESYCTATSDEETQAITEASRANKGRCVYEWEGKWAYFEDEDGAEYIDDGSIRDELEYRTEIPVPRFLDLLHDRITPWRLEEDGFTKRGSWHIFDTIVGEFCIDRDGYVYSMETEEQAHVTNYTDLLTLIRLIG
jgi:hypothetical protein